MNPDDRLRIKMEADAARIAKAMRVAVPEQLNTHAHNWHRLGVVQGRPRKNTDANPEHRDQPVNAGRKP
jgi:hypothetical protein